MMAASSEFSRFLLPGFTLPLTFNPVPAGRRWVRHDDGTCEEVEHPAEGEGGELLETALNTGRLGVGDAGLRFTTIREFTMLRLMNQLSDKPGWETKVFDDSIANKWKTEAMTTPGADVTQRMADWVIDSLRHKAGIFNQTGSVNVYDGDVVKSDRAIPESLREILKISAAGLEDVPEFQKDYHPGSDGLVLDLVHPSLFPLIYGRSRILSDSVVSLENCIEKCGKGVRTKLPPKGMVENHSGAYSGNFQWLPCEVEFVPDGENQSSQPQDAASKEYSKCKITSYINNLHPQRHADLYECIEEIIARAIPLWNRTLEGLTAGPVEPRIEYTDCVYDPDPSTLPEDALLQREEGEPDHIWFVRLYDWEQSTKKIARPDPEKFEPPEQVDPEDQFDLKRDFGHRGLQVIVKLASIHLTPEKSEYKGGSWHVEGQVNEHICSTALYYYDSKNITDSRLAFRQQVDTEGMTDIGYKQDEHEWVREVFGCDPNGPAVQDVGDVFCKEGRLITFPNILQHQVQPFRLQNASEPGHRKILALFLVDPNIRVISTANVPPQQRDWWGDVIKSTSTLDALPAEIQEEVIRAVDEFPISMDEAKELRLKLMDERKNYVVSQTSAFEGQEFSLCEH